MIKSFSEIRRRVSESTGQVLAVAGAAHASTLEAVAAAREAGVAEAVLVGPEAQIRAAADKSGVEAAGEIIDVTGDAAIAARAVELVRTGKAGMVMKGAVSTGTLLRAVLDKERGLRSGKLLSHIAALEVPGQERLLWVTDGGMNICPDLPTKAAILHNAVASLRKLGYQRPRAAVLGAVEKVNPDMPDTLDAASLTQMAARGQFGPCEVDGPLALDLAVSAEAAAVKGVGGEVVGRADILLVPDIRAGNIFAKGLLYLAGARIGGLIAGAAAPIVLLSRADDAETKLNSIALCTACTL
jgi:phosphate butyryltransferase